MLEKDTKLRKPIRLILPHFLTNLTRDQLHNHQIGFAKASHHKYTIENSERKYKFHPCDSKPLFASKGNKSYAILESDHCCFYCLQANRMPDLVRDAGYYLTRIEHSASPQRNEVYFIATYFLQTCIQVMWYSNSEANLMTIFKIDTVGFKRAVPSWEWMQNFSSWPFQIWRGDIPHWIHPT